MLLHIVFAIAIYKETNSGLMTSIFISLQWLPMLLVILYRSDWDHGINPVKRWYLLDLLSAVLTLPILFLLDESNYLLIVLILLLRGIVDQINRINKTVACRFMYPAEKVTHYASFMQTGYHFGIGVAAIVGIFLTDQLDLKVVVWIDILTFVVSAGAMLLVKPEPGIEFAASVKRKLLKARISEYVSALHADARLFFCALLPPMTATFFQGTYSVLQPIFPVEHLGLGSSAVSTSYILASLAIIVGSSAFSIFNKHYRLFERPFEHTLNLIVLLSWVTCLTYVLAMWVSHVLICAVLFTLMVLLFEFIWMAGYGGIVAYAPKNQLGSVFGISFSIGCLLASAVVTLTGVLLDYLNNDFVLVISGFMLAYIAVIAAAAMYYRRLNTHVTVSPDQHAL